MNGLSSVVDALTHAPKRRPPATIAAGKGKTGALRDLLRPGSATCEELSDRSGLPRTIVSALLNRDVRGGRVVVCEGVYRLAPGYDADELQRIRSAVGFLRARGYVVVKAKR